MVARRQIELALQEQVSLAALSAEVSVALAHNGSLQEMLRQCTEIIVRHLDAAFARIWTLNVQENVLELQASAGMYTHRDGPHSRVPVGQFKIGLIAQERQPHLTNAVIGDPRVSDQEWAQREGMVAFAGYPLLDGERLVGVVAMFARHPLTEATLKALAAVANAITLSIERLRTRDALLDSELRFRQLTEHIHEVFFLYDTDSAQMLYVSPAYEQIWGRSVQALYERMADFIDAVHPDDRPGVYAMIEQLKQGENSRMEYRIVRPNGEVRWILARAFPFQSATPSVYRVAGFAEDITERKPAEAQREQLQAQLFEAQTMEAAGASARAAPHCRPGRAQAAARLAPCDHRHPSTPRYDPFRGMSASSSSMMSPPCRTGGRKRSRIWVTTWWRAQAVSGHCISCGLPRRHLTCSSPIKSCPS